MKSCTFFNGFSNGRFCVLINPSDVNLRIQFLKLSILFLSVFLVNRFALISDVYAGEKSEFKNPTLEKGGRGDFSNKFRSYQTAVRSGKAALNKKDYQSAIAHYSRAIELSPFEVSIYYDRGISLYKIEKFKDAAGDFDKVLVMDPRRYSAYVYRGLCRVKSGEYIDALKDYTSALSINPKDAGIHNNLAWLYATANDEKIKDRAKALEHAKKAAELSNERNAEILDTLARAYFLNGMNKEAVEAEGKAVKLSPDNRFQEKLKFYEEEVLKK